MTESTTPTPKDVEDIVYPEAPPVRASVGKQVARAVVGTSVRFVVAGALSHVVPTESKKDKIKLAVGTYVISGVISQACKDYAVDRIDYYLGVTDELKIMAANAQFKLANNTPSETPTP